MKDKTRGQSLVEFALILPILLLLILGIIEGARIIWAYITVQNAAREAARYAVTGQPYDETGNPWTVRPDRYPGSSIPGCDPRFSDSGQLIYSPDPVSGGDCTGPNDRVDAIVGVALERGRGLGVDQYAIHPGVYTATSYVDEGGTFGVRVYGQEFGTDTLVDYAGKEGLNVLVQVYYNVRLLDPLYAAIIPNGYVHLAGEVQMQNEGIDSALGSLPPGGIAPPEAPPGSEYQPGVTPPPIIYSLDGSTVDVGSDLRVKLEYHTPNQVYDVYLYSLSLGYVLICSAVDAGTFGSQEALCNVPATTQPGPYQLVSIESGADADPANHVGEGDIVEVVFPGDPVLRIAESNRWPRGSAITLQLLGHLPAGSRYDVFLIGPGFPAPGLPIAVGVQVDDTGSASLPWTIPNGLTPNTTYTVVTYEQDTIDPVIASTALDIAQAEIVIQGGNYWPAGANIRVHLRGHAPNRTYRLRWIDGGTGVTTDFGPVTTDQFGNTQAPLQFRIPATTAARDDHRILSFEDSGGGQEVASTVVEVFVPADALIVVVGGDLWPAGSLIQIELHKHFNGPYDVYFYDPATGDGTLIEGGISPNASGFYQTTYVIPIATPNGTYEIRTVPVSGGDLANPEATKEIEVESVPLIRLEEGDIVQPLSEITIQLLHHAPNDSYQIFLDGNFLFSLPTDGVGGAEQIYDLSNLPGLEGGPFLLESRRDGQMVASTEIYVLAPDLLVTNIEFPPGPPVNVEIPVTVTVFNDSAVPVSGEWFDVDVYLNPVHAPTTSSQFPPGDFKRWLFSIPATGTTQAVFSMTLSSIDYTVYGRVDTSNYIIETDDTNNIYQTHVTAACAIEVLDEFGGDTSPSDWTATSYGNADIPPSNFDRSGGKMNLESDGSSSWGNSDNTYLVYHNQSVVGNFDVRVRMVEGPGDDSGEQNYAKAGLEIRDNVGAANSSKVDLAVANSAHTSWTPGVQASYRNGAGGDTDRPGDASVDVAVSYPLWLRIVREGNRFEYYYSDSDSSTPPADDAWTPHGSVEMSNMGDSVAIGFFNASYDGSATDTSSFDSFRVCVKSTGASPPPEDFPPGLTVCTDNLIQNGGFEDTQLAPWTVPGGGVNKIPEQHEGVFGAVMHTYNGAEHLHPVLGQTFDMPDWIISSTTTIDLSLYQCVRDGWNNSGAEPDDRLLVGLRSTGVAPTLITTATQVADGNTDVFGTSCEGDYAHYSTDLAAVMAANPEDYASQTLELYFHDTSSNLGVCNAPGGGPGNASCYETDYFLDSVVLEVCTTQPIPPHEPGKATIGGPLRVFLTGAPLPKQGVRVWTYKQNGELLTTYSLHDSNYYFYNVDPGEYVIYSEYWDGPNLYTAFTTVTVGPDETITGLSLLLR
jgi:hypothetical protein